MGISADDRATLLAVKGVGPPCSNGGRAVEKDRIGFDSLDALADASVGRIVRQVAAMPGTTCWKNNVLENRPQARAAIAEAIAAAGAQPPKRSKKN